ncbi:lysostaphin resistance A-like protein [Lacticaseibacillus sp. GG6-2]
MSLFKSLGRIAAVVGVFALYSVAEAISVLPTMLTNGKANAVLVGVVFAVVFGSLIYLLASMYQYFLRSETPQLFGPRRPDKKVWRFMAGMVLALVLIQALNAVAISLHWVAESQNQDALVKLLQQAPLAMVLVAVVGAPPVEELIFRGLLMHSFPHLEKRGWLVAAGTVSAVVFGLLHAGPSEPYSMVSYIAMGAVFAATYAYTKDIRYSIALHFLNNFVALFI